MVHFPDPVFGHIASYLLDPDFYKKRRARDKKKHAKVWQKIHVTRSVKSVMGFEEDEDEINECEYFVRTCDTDIIQIPVRDGFGYDHLSGEWDNVQDCCILLYEGNYEGAIYDYEWHNWAGQDE